MNDNPFEKTSDKKYGPYCISFLDDLVYLDYKLITDDDKFNAKELYKDEMIDNEQNAKDKDPSGETGVDKEFEDAGIACTVDLLSSVMKCQSDYDAVAWFP